MNRRRELWLIILVLLLAAVLRVWDLSRLPPGFNDNELAYIRITETVRDGGVAVHYQAGDEHGRTLMYGVGNMLATVLAGDGLFSYRVFPAAGGLVTLAVLYLLARRLFGTPVGLIALALMAVNLRAILLARTGTPDAFVPGYVVLTLYCITKAFHLRREVAFRAPDTLPFALLAVLAGASGYLHYTALVLGPLTALFFAHLLITRQPISRQMWNAMVFMVVLATVTAVPYVVSTLRQPEHSEPYILVSERPRSVLDVIDGLLHAVGGVIWRGDPNPAHNLPDAALVGPGVAALLVVGASVAIRRRREPGYALMLMALGAGLLTDAWVGVDPTFTANLVALPAVFILAAIGLMTVGRWLRVRGVRHAVPLLALLIVAANLIAVRARLFHDFPHNPAVEDAYHANLGRLAAYLDRTPDDLPVSLCTARLNAPDEVGLTPRQILRLMLTRETLAIRHSDCRSGLVFVNAGAPMRFIFADPADRAQMPPELLEWLDGAPSLPAEGLPEGTVLYLDVEQRIRDMGGFWDLRAPAYFMPGDNGLIQRADLPAQLEQNLTFTGYDPRLYAGKRVPGSDPIVLVSYWRVDGPLPDNLGVFAHLLAYPNPLLAPVAEANALDVIPSELKNRDLFAQVSYIWLGDAVVPGEYWLTVGGYTNEAAMIENHLEVLDSTLNYQPHGDRLLLGRIYVEPPPGTGTAETELKPGGFFR